MTHERPDWLSPDTGFILDMFRDACAEEALVHTAENRERAQQLERDMLEAVKADVLRAVGMMA